MTLTAFNRRRREEAQRRQAIIVKPAPVHEPTPEELAAQAVAEYAKGVRKLNKGDLVAMATERGVETAGLNKEQLIAALTTLGPAPATEGGEGGEDGSETGNDAGAQESE